jgi:hypothetical protein
MILSPTGIVSPSKSAYRCLGALCAAGLLLGYFSQANWAGQHNEPLGWLRLLGGLIGAGLLYPGLIGIWCRLLARLLGRDSLDLLRQITPLAAALALVFFFPSPMLTRIGVLTASVVLALAAILLAALMGRGLSPAYLLCLGLMAAVCVELHDLAMRFYDAVGIERGLKADAQALFRYRVLVHYLAGGMETIFQAPAPYMAKLIRTLATFTIFLASIKTAEFLVRRSVALAAPLAHLVMLPFSYLFLYETEPWPPSQSSWPASKPLSFWCAAALPWRPHWPTWSCCPFLICSFMKPMKLRCWGPGCCFGL